MIAAREQKGIRENRFDWPLCPDAQDFVLSKVEAFQQRNSFTRTLANRMSAETGTLFLDWIDHIVLGRAETDALQQAGYRPEPAETPIGETVYWHPEAMLPRVLIDERSREVNGPKRVAIRPESISDFMTAHRVDGEPEGTPPSRF